MFDSILKKLPPSTFFTDLYDNLFLKSIAFLVILICLTIIEILLLDVEWGMAIVHGCLISLLIAS